ncbi:MAG: hypothetical protein WCI27_09810 [Candidatus Omnitrophota bacterium]
MKKISLLLKSFVFLIVCFNLVGCVSIPKGFLKIEEKSLEKRQVQMRQYETTDETKILTAVAGVLQDLSFTLDNSETKLGFVAGSKKADATNKGQIFWMALLGGANAVAQCDGAEVIKASVITKPGANGKTTVVRATFQRVVWNQMGQVNRVESINDLDVYQKFYDSLSKAIFLEAQKI